jgi:hypothetical protein
MGVIGAILGGRGTVEAVGETVKEVAEVFTPNATRRMELSAEAQQAALAQMGLEFQHPATGWFDRFVDGLNRLPRPALAFGTLGLFAYAMVDPAAFTARMVGLNAVPEPLWWLLGAVVGFYFGAREAHYFRTRPAVAPGAASGATQADGPVAERPSADAPAVPPDTAANPALEDWRQSRG